jgi:hypothetical protein
VIGSLSKCCVDLNLYDVGIRREGQVRTEAESIKQKHGEPTALIKLGWRARVSKSIESYATPPAVLTESVIIAKIVLDFSLNVSHWRRNSRSAPIAAIYTQNL